MQFAPFESNKNPCSLYLKEISLLLNVDHVNDFLK